MTGEVPPHAASRLRAAFARHGVTQCALLTSTFRSGSTFVAALLGHNGVPGLLEERFNDVWQATSIDDHLDRVIAPFAGGQFPTKIMWPQRNNLARMIDAPRKASAQFAAAFPGARWLHVRRRDTFRQAISFWRAQQSDRWQVYEPGDEPEIPYSFEQIDACARELAFHDRLWGDFFERAAITPYSVVYEDVLAHPDILDGYLARFGARIADTQVKLRRQADDLTDRYLDRYLGDLYARGD